MADRHLDINEFLAAQEKEKAGRRPVKPVTKLTTPGETYEWDTGAYGVTHKKSGAFEQKTKGAPGEGIQYYRPRRPDKLIQGDEDLQEK